MKKNLLLLTLLSIPTITYASSGSDDLSIGVVLAMEAFVSIHMSLFVLKPLANIFGKEGEQNKLFKKLFIIRVIILLIFDFFITPLIFVIDFFGVFIGAFLIVPISSAIKKKNPYQATKINKTNVETSATENLTIKCAKCNAILTVNDKFCGTCGAAFDGNNVIVEEKIVEKKVIMLPGHFDKIYQLGEEEMLDEFIKKELSKAEIDINNPLIPQDILRRKKILNIIFSILLAIFIALIFFHFPIYTYIIGIILIFIFYKYTKKYSIIKYLKKQIKARPSEKISNIVMNTKVNLTTDNSKTMFIVCICIAIILPMIIFIKPRILYEKTDGGYAVRYYTFGITNFTSATIPGTYKNEKVVSLRGNTFSNMPLLKEVILPDSITEIRGQAFKNNRSLEKVTLPNNLIYLGGGAFYNCTSLKSIEIPDSVTQIGGEAFYNAKSLETAKLSKNIVEIRGSTFENCKSLKSIEIPDSVTRIGGHAFYANTNLSEVTFTENSMITEIGSSAFRMCDNLYSITLPYGVYINERAFKESPTNINYFNEPQIKKNTLTLSNNGTQQYINSKKYGDIYLNITYAELKDDNLRVTLKLSGGINTTIEMICDGTIYYIYDDFYITTYNYYFEVSTTTFDFYYE